MCSRTFNIATGNLFTWRGSKTLSMRFGDLVHEAQKNLSIGVENRSAGRARVENHDPRLVHEGMIGASSVTRCRTHPPCAPWSLLVA
jgi:hypothetical protein